MAFLPRRILLTLLIAASACGRKGELRAGARVYVPLARSNTVNAWLDSTDGSSKSFVVLTNLHPTVLAAVRRDAANIERPPAWLYVPGQGDYSSGTPMAGQVVVNDTAVELHPRFPLDAGRQYGIGFRLPSTVRLADAPPGFLYFALDKPVPSTRTSVRAIYPSSDTVPENLLRVYVEFSAPMSRTGGLDFISLRDENDRVVPATFLPLDADFWNDDRTRYTAFLDPGRVKRGILPNEQMGRAIHAGHTYSIVVDSAWRDANGTPLAASFRQRFFVRAPDERVIDLAAWNVRPPRAQTYDTLVVTFPKALDRGLLLRAVGVVDTDSTTVDGVVSIAPGERMWRFVPTAAWHAGRYGLLVLEMLEDPAGNRIDRPFEVDMFDRVDKGPSPERRFIPFVVGSASR